MLLAAVAVGCGTGGLADPEATGSAPAQELFQQKCGGCHALEAAGTRGQEGPDLDAAFRAARDEGLGEVAIRQTVLGQMRWPIPPMPPAEELFPLEGDYTAEDRESDLHAIATYVASVAANEEAIAQARAAGQGGDGDDPRALFTANCAGCHAFEPAGSTATVGPGLDDTSLEVEAIARQIALGGGGMPPFENALTDEQIRALAEWIASGGDSG